MRAVALRAGGAAALVTIASVIVVASSARAQSPRSASAAAADTTVTVTGSGFGHGVGMSQFGALGMARAGASAGTILRHYYTGTTVAAHPDAMDLRVNVVDRGTSVELRTEAISRGGGAMHLSPADDIFVRIERELDIDTQGQLIASVSVSYTHLTLPTNREV